MERIETLSAKLMSQREAEATIVDNYQQELQAKTKLADLYQRVYFLSQFVIVFTVDTAQFCLLPFNFDYRNDWRC